jgi:hypothetical protein
MWRLEVNAMTRRGSFNGALRVRHGLAWPKPGFTPPKHEPDARVTTSLFFLGAEPGEKTAAILLFGVAVTRNRSWPSQ